MGLLNASILIVVSTGTVLAQGLLTVYNGAAPPAAPKAIAKVDQTIFKQQILPAARRAWRSRQKECTNGWEGEPAIRGVVQGSFTKPGTQQRAILYNYCTPAHAYAFNGLAVVEDGQVVAHLAYQSDWQNSIATAPDIDQNGLTEIILVAGTTNQGITWATATPIEFSGDAVRKFGFAQVFSDNCGNNESEGVEAWKLYARQGLIPVFYLDSFKKGCSEKRWRRVKASVKVTLDEDPTDYRHVR